MVKSLFIGLALLLANVVVFGQTGTVVFKISNIQLAKGGEISAGIFTKANFPKVGRQLKGTEVKVEAEVMEVTLDAVPTGTYGAVAFQDVNEDKDLATNLVGFPKEPIGFANGAKIRFGPPSFKAAAIQVKPGEVTIVAIKLK